MRNRLLLLGMAFLLPLTLQAQWRVGATAGAGYNLFSMDKQYLADYQIGGRWGTTAGVSVQYDINDWLGVRANLNWTQKNYRKYRIVLYEMDYMYQNDYLQLPVMASFYVGGGKRLRGIFNLGVYAGYWLDSYRKGSDLNSFDGYMTYFHEKITFNAESDQRLDFGLLGGAGVEYRIATHWSLQAEACCYYSTVSTTRQYMRVKDYRYNTTIAAQLGVFYLF